MKKSDLGLKIEKGGPLTVLYSRADERPAERFKNAMRRCAADLAMAGVDVGITVICRTMVRVQDADDRTNWRLICVIDPEDGNQCAGKIREIFGRI